LVSSYIAIDGGVVLMENNVSCNIVRVGNINIEMFDGIVRLLTDVRHIPKIKNNLIYLGVYDCGG